MCIIRTQEIIEHLNQYIEEQGGDRSIWYVGICQDAYGFGLNSVKISNHFWMYIETGSPQIANEVLDNCVNTMGLNRDIDNMTQNELCSIVYIYKKRLTSKS